MSKPLILVADDQADVRRSISLLLQDSGYEVMTAASPAEVLSSLRQSQPDLLLLDLNYQRDTTSGHEGLELLKEIRGHDAAMPIIVLTGWATVGLAVQAMQLGAQDFLEKPWDNTRVRTLLTNHLNRLDVLTKLRDSTDTHDSSDSNDDLVCRSKKMEEIMSTAKRVAQTDAAILLTGESGSGKGLLARWIHEHSGRSEHAFAHVNLGGLAENLFESELFGHVKGAFTDARSDRVGRFESANEGTLFLDEIANISPAQQARLLRVLEEGHFERVGETASRRTDARIIAATNADIHKLIEESRFRQDLYFRLNIVEIEIPPLRKRREDIAPLVGHYLKHFRLKYGRPQIELTPVAIQALEQYDWPGNVRELAHVMQRAVLLSHGEQIGVADLRLASGESVETLETLTLEQAERYVIRRALEAVGGDVEAAAEKLGLSRSALYRRLEKLRE